jgi:uncharacterized membrane-anchored protein YitT (DUF2179 family)
MGRERKPRKKRSKAEIKGIAKNYLWVTLGCFVLAVGDAFFLTPCHIVSGGVYSIGLIINHYLEPLVGFDTNTLMVAAIQVALLLVGFLVLGPKFGLKTLYASLIYPGFYSLLYDTHCGEAIGLGQLYEVVNASQPDYAMTLVAALFGGALAGLGVALGYQGSGSTGGLDVLSEIIAQYTDVKQDLSSFIFDTAIIIAGMAVFQEVNKGLIGIISAFCCAVAILFVYIYGNAYIIVDIISSEYETIQKYIHEEMEHATTEIETVGGYSGEKRKMIRVVIYHNEESELKTFIASVDPKAFISFSTARTINGEGFKPLRYHAKERIWGGHKKRDKKGSEDEKSGGEQG